MKAKRQPKVPASCQDAFTLEIMGERFKANECVIERAGQSDLWCEWCKANLTPKKSP